MALPILVLTVSLALARPRLGSMRIGHAKAAILGAGLSVVTGVVSPEQASRALATLIYPALAIVSLMVLTLVAEQAGLFQNLAVRIARVARGDGRKLFTLIFVAGTLTGAIFTNDATVLIFTPLVYNLIQDVKERSWGPTSETPYYFAVLYVANLVGVFVVSNPINIIVASIFAIDFVEYARWMIVPALVSMAVSYVGLRVCFRKSLPDTCRLPSEPAAPGNRRFMVLSAAVLGLTLLGFFAESRIGVPTWAVAAIGATVLFGVSATLGWSDPGRVIRGVGWDVIIFVAGIFIVVTGLREAGLTTQLERLILYVAQLGEFSLIVANGLATATFSAIMNNHSTAYTFALAIDDMPMGWEHQFANGWHVKRILVFSSLIGGDLGPKMLPIGSLAALLWFRMLRDRGVEIPYRLYVRFGVPITLAAVMLSVLTLYLEYALVVMGR